MPIAIHPILRRISPNWSLTGATASNTLDGRLWARLSVSGGTFTLNLYRRASMQSGDLVATGTGAGPAITLSQSNASGFSGSVELAPDAASKLAAQGGVVDGPVQAALCFDADLSELEPDIAALLDAEGEYAGSAGFEVALNAAARGIGAVLSSRLQIKGWCESDAREALALVDDPEVFRVACTHAALARIYDREAGRGDVHAANRAVNHRRESRAELAAIRTRVTRSDGRTTVVSLGNPSIRAW